MSWVTAGAPWRAAAARPTIMKSTLRRVSSPRNACSDSVKIDGSGTQEAPAQSFGGGFVQQHEGVPHVLERRPGMTFEDGAGLHDQGLRSNGGRRVLLKDRRRGHLEHPGHRLHGTRQDRRLSGQRVVSGPAHPGRIEKRLEAEPASCAKPLDSIDRQSHGLNVLYFSTISNDYPALMSLLNPESVRWCRMAARRAGSRAAAPTA